MRITYDEPKRALNLEVHGFDFADFAEGFDFDTAKQFPTYASPFTGRTRFGLIGWFRGEVVVVGIVSPLGSEALSLVSFRHASKRERTDNGF